MFDGPLEHEDEPHAEQRRQHIGQHREQAGQFGTEQHGEAPGVEGISQRHQGTDHEQRAQAMVLHQLHRHEAMSASEFRDKGFHHHRQGATTQRDIGHHQCQHASAAGRHQLANPQHQHEGQAPGQHAAQEVHTEQPGTRLSGQIQGPATTPGQQAPEGDQDHQQSAPDHQQHHGFDREANQVGVTGLGHQGAQVMPALVELRLPVCHR